MNPDIAHTGFPAGRREVPGEVTWLIGGAEPGGEHQIAVLPGFGGPARDRRPGARSAVSAL
jgi:hypothetical protein